MSTASMTFGRPSRIVIPRGSIWFANLAFALINLMRRIDRWQLERAEHEPRTAAEVMELARRIEKTDPGFAADLRAAALRSNEGEDR
jgi:hypothetical protein